MASSIVLDSKNATGNAGEGTIKIQESIQGKWYVESFSCFNSFYNVNSNNNTIVWNENETDKMSTLTIGSYTGSQLASELATKLTADGVEIYTGTYDSKTGKITISNPSLTFYLDFTTTNNHSLFGFTQGVSNSGISLTSPNVCDLSPIKHIYMKINDNDTDIISSSNYFHASLDFNDNSTFGDVMRYKSKDSYLPFILSFDRPTKLIKYKFIDIDQNEIDFNGVNWTLHLRKL